MAGTFRRRMFKSKIHRATVTHADLNYEGSWTIPSDLMEAADILPGEEVHIWNITNGNRLATYAVEGPAGSGIMCANGGAAHRCQPGDLVVIATFVEMDDSDARSFRPTVVHVDASNHIVDVTQSEIVGPQFAGR